MRWGWDCTSFSNSKHTHTHTHTYTNSVTTHTHKKLIHTIRTQALSRTAIIHSMTHHEGAQETGLSERHWGSLPYLTLWVYNWILPASERSSSFTQFCAYFRQRELIISLMGVVSISLVPRPLPKRARCHVEMGTPPPDWLVICYSTIAFYPCKLLGYGHMYAWIFKLSIRIRNHTHINSLAQSVHSMI